MSVSPKKVFNFFAGFLMQFNSNGLFADKLKKLLKDCIKQKDVQESAKE